MEQIRRRHSKFGSCETAHGRDPAHTLARKTYGGRPNCISPAIFFREMFLPCHTLFAVSSILRSYRGDDVTPQHRQKTRASSLVLEAANTNRRRHPQLENSDQSLPPL